MSVELLYPEEGHKRSDVVAGNVRAEAARKGFSQTGLARALGQRQSTINPRWRGLFPWSVDELDAIAAILGISFEDLTKDPRSVGRTGGDTVRLKGLEPPTFWLVSPPDPTCTVTDINLAREKRAA